MIRVAFLSSVSLIVGTAFRASAPAPVEIDEAVCIGETPGLGIVAGASYHIYQGANESSHGIPMTSRHVTFYAYDGTPLATYRYRMGCFSSVEIMLDPTAPKPQPATCVINYWPACELVFGMTKGVPGWFIVFYDRNGNKITRYRYDRDTHVITTGYSRTAGNTTFLLDEATPQALIDNAFPLDLRNLMSVVADTREYEAAIRRRLIEGFPYRLRDSVDRIKVRFFGNK